MSLVYLQASDGTKYFFDAVFKEAPTFTNTISSNPVQTGANVNDHVYNNPVTLTLEIGMSDVMTSIKSGQYSSAANTRSISAFQTFEQLWEQANYMAVSTSFGIFKSMVIQSFAPYRDAKTQNAMKATIVLQQIITVSATEESIVATSSDSQTTNSTVKNAVNSVSYNITTQDDSVPAGSIFAAGGLFDKIKAAAGN
jgi:hypothetical protein